MPVQRTLFGRPLTLRIPPLRFQLLFAFVLLVLISLLTVGPPPQVPSYDQVAEAVKNPHIPKLPEVNLPANPFGKAAHQPPVQANSSATGVYGAVKWFSDFKWRNPFSEHVTLDENRAVLPPLKERPPIYTFYDPKGKVDKTVSEAENRLILAWRRAWWAQGFKPQVLSRAEAMRHPQYQLVQRMKLDTKVELEMMRWFAWGHMGGGVLANWLALPMSDYDNPMLAFLRRNEYPALSRVDSLHNGIFFGQGAAVNDAIKKAVNGNLLKNVTAHKNQIAQLAKKDGGAMVGLLDPSDIKVDAKAHGIAYYSTENIANRYKTVAEKLTNETQVQGLQSLADLINSHLHLTFQESYPDGIAVVKPLPEHTTALMYEAIDIARNLTQCPATPMPKSCPPNRPKCSPCDPNKPLKMHLQPFYRNATSQFSIGTVPHPYTLNSLHYTRDVLDASFIRKNAERNLWLNALTRPPKDGAPPHTEAHRVVDFKTAVAASPNTLWLTAERETHTDLDWIFGFQLPRRSVAGGSLGAKAPETGLIISPRPGDPAPIEGTDVPEERWVRNEEMRLRKARDALRSQDRHMKEVLAMVEEWNPFDTEAWRFARAYSARRRVEREVWEEEERKFAGTEKKAGVGSGRWDDKREGYI